MAHHGQVSTPPRLPRVRRKVARTRRLRSIPNAHFLRRLSPRFIYHCAVTKQELVG
jgi:hypothetical protein